MRFHDGQIQSLWGRRWGGARGGPPARSDHSRATGGPDRQTTAEGHPFRCRKNSSFCSLPSSFEKASEALRSPVITDGSGPVYAAG